MSDTNTSIPELPKAYKPLDHEDRIRERWMAAKAFHADPARVLSGEAEPYCVVIPPPNVTAALHLGHALNNTLQDVLVRSHRMMGFEALWMPGTDHAGIATQAVVEKRLRKEGKLKGALKQAYSRDAFVAEVQSFKDEYEAVITGQLKKMGCSCDWDRQRFTMDDTCARAVREAFFRLFKDGLIYRGKRLVNWDPALQTAVADDECYDEEVDAAFYYLRYPLVHEERHQGIEASRQEDPQPVTWEELARRGYPGAEGQNPDEAAWITVATTRPETYLGDTAVAVNPHDPRAKALRGLFIELPLVGRVIPILEDSYVVLPKEMARNEEEAADPKAQFATGFLKVTPAHDPNDYEIGRRHSANGGMQEWSDARGKAVLINMLSPDGRVSDKHGWSDVGDAHLFVGMKREEARTKVVEEFKARGLLEKVTPYRHSVKHSDRSKAVIEPYLSDQWYVKVTDERLAGAANRALALGSATHARGTGVTPVSTESSSLPPAIQKRLHTSARNLPHWQFGGCTYFVTFRTDRGTMSDAERDAVLSACKHWDGERLELHACVVMPDHVHMLFSPFEKSKGEWYSLSELMHSIKSFSSHAINKARVASGKFWQDESYDRIVRVDEYPETLSYILNNPLKAGLVEDWRAYRWTFVPDETLDGKSRFPRRWWGDSQQMASEVGGLVDHRPEACATSIGREGIKAERHQGSEAGDGALAFHPERYAKTYEQWHDGIRDWCISRQLWWGHRIPVWRSDIVGFSNENQMDTVARVDGLLHHWESQGRIASQERSLTDDMLPPALIGFQVSRRYVCVRDANDDEILALLKGAGFSQDPDVLDTWFSSGLWPMSTMGWPDAEQAAKETGIGDFPKLLEAFNPTSTLCTAREIITLWVSRMVMFNRYFMGEGKGNGPVPFRDVFVHAVIQDGEGRKMSKSLGNGVDPLDIIATHGADAMRFTVCSMATNTQDVRLPVKKDPQGRNTSDKFDAGRNFCNKLWNAARFAVGIITAAPDAESTNAAAVKRSELAPIDRWMLSRLENATREINEAIGNFEFAGYAQTIYSLLWNDFCDWYLEGIKPTVAESPAQRAVLRGVLDAILRLLHPIAPYVTEAVYETVKLLPVRAVEGLDMSSPRKGELLCTAGWPKVSASLHDEVAEKGFGHLQGFITAIREVRAQHNVPPKRKIVLHAPAHVAGEWQSHLVLLSVLAGLETMTTDAAAGTHAVFTFEGREYAASNLADAAAVDTGAEIERLKKVVADCEKVMATLEGRLANPGYALKAPPKMVQETKDQLAKAIADRSAAAEAMKKIGG
jgi:valyl-tRNA synthetase